MFKLKVNNIDIEVEEGLTVLQACEKAGVEIPRFCYHEKLSIAGNCRMCLVEMEKSPKPVASCAMPASEGMNIKTNTALVEKARKGVMEFLLVNHPLDCPVCDQGGECDLQDQSMFYGVDKSRFKENKRAVSEKNMGPLIKTQMTRCIHCTRCIRFATEIAGVPEIGAIGRGEDMQITTYLEQSMQSELSANVVDLCPVGALTSKPYVFEARPWELKKTETIDVMDAIGSNVRVDTYDWEVKRVLPIINENINEEWISDKTRYACDGLQHQRLDAPFIKYNGKFEKASWEEVYKIIKSKFENTSKDKVCGFVGDLTNMETGYIFKEFFDRTLDIKNYESRSDNRFIDTGKRENYLFNSSINGIEESDLIFLIGTNPRYEATILNARIRKSYLNNNTKIISLNDLGDLTYPYESLDGQTQLLKDIFDGNNEISKQIINANKPMVILGESLLNSNSSRYLFKMTKEFLTKNNKINDDWNAFNILSCDAATVGNFDLGIINEENNLLDDLKNHKFDIVYLVGQDNLNFDKKELSEHLMLLDLGRNDAGKVSKINSVKVTESFIIERYSHVMHIVSNVIGEYNKKFSKFKSMLAGFPAGTVSGAPKIRAMEIIDELESTKRKVYAGSIGYFSANGEFDTCIALRTAVAKNKKFYVQAGAGIVADSKPINEYGETVNKAKALINALR